MAFTMKEEEFFAKYLAHVVIEGKETDARAAVTRLFAAINTQDGNLDTVKEELLPQLLSYVDPKVKDDTEKLLLNWLAEKA
ncbi:hypothetical protein [Enterococcus nangangensis]|uniref:hypothetical protein n=1 Tax=Enterococcus nangangensis TaxID=2559926 RepID=UPI0010FA0673|nr:hypothetical protein [Enterococcus nangangensis]